MSQTELADRAGFDNSTISKWEAAARPTVPSRSAIESLEKALGLIGHELSNAAGFATPRDRQSLSYNGEDLTPEQEQEVLDYINWIRDREKRPS